MPDEPYYPWNDVELRDAEEGSISTGHVCNYCFCIVPWFHFDKHMEAVHNDNT